MGYYIRILGTQDPDIHLDELLENLKIDGLTAKFSFAEGDAPDSWTLIEVANDRGDTLAQIERNPVIEGELGQEELSEFRKEVEELGNFYNGLGRQDATKGISRRKSSQKG